MKVLIVDDARSSCLLIAAIVERHGHVAIKASSGEEAIELFRERHPDLVLMDVTLPKMDGYEATRRIRGFGGPGWVPIIFLSASEQAVDVARGIAAGGDDYLTKPIDQVVLSAKVRAMQRIVEMRQELMSLSEQLKASNAELARLANIDGLTGIANRRVFDRELTCALTQATERGEPLAVLLADVDFFKRYNDSLGHQMGDDCLRRVAAAIAASTFQGPCLAARYGGEEFAVLVPNCDLSRALAVGEAMRMAVESLRVEHPDSTIAPHVTLSIGATAGPEDGGGALLLARADAALYRAKKLGRNRVCV